MNRILKNSIIFTIFITFLALFGCAKQNKTQQIKKPEIQYHKEIGKFKVTAKKLSLNKANILTSKKIIKTYQPIEIRIENSSDNTYLLSNKNIDLEIASLKQVSKKLRTNLFMSLLLPGLSINSPKYYANMLLSVLSLPIMLFGPAVYYPWAIASSSILNVGLTGRDNQKTKDTIKINATDLKNGDLEIKPNNVLSTIIFVEHKKFKPQFDLTLIDKKTKQTTIFNIDLTDQAESKKDSNAK
ncbi:TPA: hypothetical protein DEO28_04585 [Candidatus Dependentiae bacterium]|nr:MAG: hypothetical protein UR14_C0002G0035 [candidate division TM6 bacterium GW2011_GWE2_31_21]KKP53832.1 MAG: hypothetical protein UR43_C0002G0035 [candidate division TM6 bacterium GW2011_GWF2_33_332]HBS47612.1 hypothetical protein [Candidatus Dependentiae bacterium]HBZ73761.1 hypothetical protein [Candidatus Dependentiae bacterium]